MNITVTHHVDASEPDVDGQYDYRYEFDRFEFTDQDRSLVVVCYCDELHIAYLKGLAVNSVTTPLTAATLNSALVVHAVEHLRVLGKTEFRWRAADGYRPVP